MSIRDWMERERSNAPPTLDKDSLHSDTLVPTQCLHHLDVNRMTHDVQEWADTIVGDSHLVKRNTRLGLSERKGERSNSQKKLKMMKRLAVKRAQLTLVLVMV
jgi:hypothetical protein